jgi:enamine deaminase RidA (YjgF/YER057c/UK114 family)
MNHNVILPEANRRAYESFHYAPAVRVGDLLIFSGQIGLDDRGKVPGDPEAEFRNAWRAIGLILSEVGLGYGNIVEYTSYHVGLQANLATFMKIRDEFIQAPWPAWTAIGVSELAAPGARVEVKVMATI